MKIIRTLAVLGAALYLIPAPPPGAQGPEAQPSNWALMSAATEAFGDVKAFCTRQPKVCETADYIAERAEAKAKYSIKFIYEWANKAAEPSVAFFSKDRIMTVDLPPVFARNGSVPRHMDNGLGDDIITATTTPALDLRPTFED